VPDRDRLGARHRRRLVLNRTILQSWCRQSRPGGVIISQDGTVDVLHRIRVNVKGVIGSGSRTGGRKFLTSFSTI